jgi:SAM-dependent methyltransferase
LDDNTAKFTGLADGYAKYRPTYGKEFIDYLYGEVGFGKDKTIADIGAGTGIFSRLLLERGSKVICVETNADMMKTWKKYLSGFPDCEFVFAPAEHTTLPDKSVDFITAAQSFHWFDEENFQIECKRILKDGGKVVLIWNSRVFAAEAVKEGDEINRRYCPNFGGFNGGDRGIVPDNHASFFKDGIVKYKTFPNNYIMDEESFIGRHLSASYAPKKTNENFADYVGELKLLFKKYAVNGIYEMPNVVESYVGEV